MDGRLRKNMPKEAECKLNVGCSAEKPRSYRRQTVGRYGLSTAASPESGITRRNASESRSERLGWLSIDQPDQPAPARQRRGRVKA